MRLAGRKIVLGVTGGIAAYKACGLLRLCMQEEADVRVVMTRSATEFVTPLTFRALSGHPVLTGLYASETQAGESDESGVEHIDLIRQADLFVIAPATANTLAKAAQGIGDDALSTVLLAAGKTKILWAPAMNHRMWDNAATQSNVETLSGRGHRLVPPEDGWMACREYGKGRMAEPETILECVVSWIGRPQDLRGTRVLITAGRTQEPIDPVRMLTNRSSGRMGVALAEDATARGAHVTMITGAMDVPPPENMTVVQVQTASDMEQACRECFPQSDVLLMAAAVGDYRPIRSARQKMKRRAEGIQLNLEPTPDIVKGLAASRRENQVMVAFALETENAVEEGKAKRLRKGVDLIVINNPNDPGAAIGGTTNVVTLVDDRGMEESFPLMAKSQVAETIMNWVADRLKKESNHVRSSS